MQEPEKQRSSASEIKPFPPKQAPTASNLSGKPVVLFLSIMGSIFVTEALVMIVLQHFHDFPYFLEALLDAFLLSLTLAPILYFLSLRPLLDNIRNRERIEIEREKALEFDRMKNGFISTAAHELLTPLSVVKGYVELLLSGERKFNENEQQEFLSIVYDKSETLARIVDDMLELSRIEAGQPLALKLERTDTFLLLENIVNSFRHSYPRHRIESFLPEDIPPLLLDRARIGRVLRILLDNAVKYSHEGSTIRVVVLVGENEVRFQVIDEGIGMTDEQRRRMFEKFYRADSSDTAKGGMGLGMTIAKVIVTSHGGRIWAESRDGSGTMVNFTLPRSPKIEDRSRDHGSLASGCGSD